MTGKHASGNPDSDHLRFLESMDRINRAIQGNDVLEKLICDVLDEALTIFGCDRAALFYPCAPESATWMVRMQRARPGLADLAAGVELPTDEETAAVFRALLATDAPVRFGPESDKPLPPEMAKRFNIRSQIATALFPKGDKPWMFALHQCSQPRIWTVGEARLLQEIGRRLADALGSLLTLRELRDSEAKYRRFVETSNEGILRLDGDNRISFVNARMAEMLGYTEEELVGRAANDFMFPDQVVDHQRQFTSRRQGISGNYERRLRCKDGSELWAMVSATPILDDKGDFQGSFGMLTDITERKRAEEIVQQSEEALKEAQRIAHMGSWHMDLATHQVFWSEELYRMYGYNPALPPPLYTESAKLFTPESWERLSSAITRVVETGIPYELELEMVPIADGSKWMLARGELVRDAQGRPVRVRGVVLDITERKQAEIGLNEKQQLLLEAQRIGHIGNWWHDLLTDEMDWSDEVYEIFGIDKQASGASYKTFLETIHPEDREMVDRTYKESLSNRTPYDIVHRLLMKDGKIKYVNERCETVFGEDGKPLRSVGTVQDITHMREVEEQLRQAQKMEAVGTLVGGIAHDFNNKLAAITGNLYLALRDMTGTPEAEAHLKAIEQLSFEAANMVKQLLTFARKGTVRMSPLSLVSFIKETTQLNRVAIPEDIRLSISYADDPLPVLGDITQLQQLFLNLLTNARDALQGMEQPRIDISLEYYKPDAAFCEQHPEADAAAAFACLKVCDNGMGIEPQHVEQVFDPFFTTKEVGKGTGLGLAMVYGVVQSHHGIVEVDSRRGEGTCFSIYLPLHAETEIPPVPYQQHEIVEGQGETILLADDDADVLEAFAEMLESIRYRVLQARNGREAIELFRRHAAEIDLVILDMVMPEMKGPQVAARIRDIDPDARLLFATGYDSELNTNGSTNGIQVLNKPYLLDQVSKTIRRLLDG